MIYYLQRADGAIKIGVARHFPTRLKTLTKEHGPLDLLALEEGAYPEETARHRQFAAERFEGEWFHPSPALISHIKALPEEPEPLALKPSGAGFVMVPAWLLGRRPSGNALLLYCSLAGYGTFNPGSGQYEECRPSLPTLIKLTGFSQNTVRRALDELLKIGAIERSEARYAANGGQLPFIYRVLFGVIAGPRGATGETPLPPVGETPDPATRETAPVPPTGPNQEPSTKNQNTKPSASPRGTRCPDDFMPSDSTKAWCEREMPAELFSRAGAELMKFRLHWTNKTGRDATKISWDRAFQTWMLNARDRYGVRPVSGPPASKPFVQQADEYKARKAEAEALFKGKVDALLEQGVPLAEAMKAVDEAKRAFLAQEPVATSSPMPYIDGVILSEDPKEVTGS